MSDGKTFPILVSYLVFIAIGVASGLLNIAWTYMQPTFGVSLDALGTLLAAGMLGGLIAAFLSGALIGRFSIGPYLVGGIVFAGLGMLAYAAAPIWLLLLGAAFIASIGKGAIDTGLNNFFAANCSTSQMNWLHACWGIGLTLAPALVTWFVLDSAVGWRGSYIVTGVAILALGAAILLSLPRWQLGGSGAESPSSADPGMPLRSSLRQSTVIIGLLFFFVYGGVEIGTGQLANTLLVESRGLAQERASAWVSGYWGSFTLGRMLMGLLAMRLGDRSLLAICFTLCFGGAFCLLMNLHDLLSLGGLLSLGFGLAAIFPILILQTPSRVGDAHAANAIGFQVGCTGLGSATLSGLAAAFTGHLGVESISLFIFLGAALMVLIYLVMARWANRPAAAQ